MFCDNYKMNSVAIPPPLCRFWMGNTWSQAVEVFEHWLVS